ncbi:MAG: AMP-binding protein [Opitutales bacterium]|nr:AMP-binding protein [Opitutales bacterium]
MLEKFLKQTTFSSQEDFEEHFEIKVPENFNFAYDVVDEWAKIEPEKRAMLWVNDQGEERVFTFADMKKYSDQVASFFQSKGIGRGDMVMLILKRRYEFWFSILALHKLGAVAIPATHLLTAKDITFRCNAADIKAIVCAGDVVITSRISEALPQCPSVQHVFSTGPLYPDRFEDFQDFANAAPFVRPETVNENSDISLLYFTSGTTGHPKMVAHDFLYPLGHIVTGSFWHNLNENSLHLTVADTGWGKAAWGKLYGQWIAGATVFVYDHEKFTPRDMLRMISKYHITSFCAPPTVFRFMLREKLGNVDISSLKWCTIAGEALNPSVYEAFRERTGISLREGFGQTETTCSILTTPWMKPKPGSMGKPNPSYNVDLVDENGNSVPPGVQGEIIIRVDPQHRPLGLFKCYYRDERLTRRALMDNIYYTGDVATRDADGYYWFVGRNDDVIKSSGYRIGPFEVESALMSHPAVVECAITGVPDPIRGMAVKATIVLAKEYREHPENFEALRREIQDHVKKETAPYKYPRIVEFVDELPKTISGKIRRVELRQKAESFVEKIVPVSIKESAIEIVDKIPIEKIDERLEEIKATVDNHIKIIRDKINQILPASDNDKKDDA